MTAGASGQKLVLVPGGHFDAYVGEGFEISSGAARDWFVEHLGSSSTAAAEASRRFDRTLAADRAPDGGGVARG